MWNKHVHEAPLNTQILVLWYTRSQGETKVSFVTEGILSSVTATTWEPGLTQSVCSKNGGGGVGRDDQMSTKINEKELEKLSSSFHWLSVKKLYFS